MDGSVRKIFVILLLGLSNAQRFSRFPSGGSRGGTVRLSQGGFGGQSFGHSGTSPFMQTGSRQVQLTSGSGQHNTMGQSRQGFSQPRTVRIASSGQGSSSFGAQSAQGTRATNPDRVSSGGSQSQSDQATTNPGRSSGGSFDLQMMQQQQQLQQQILQQQQEIMQQQQQLKQLQQQPQPVVQQAPPPAPAPQPVQQIAHAPMGMMNPMAGLMGAMDPTMGLNPMAGMGVMGGMGAMGGMGMGLGMGGYGMGMPFMSYDTMEDLMLDPDTPSSSHMAAAAGAAAGAAAAGAAAARAAGTARTAAVAQAPAVAPVAQATHTQPAPGSSIDPSIIASALQTALSRVQQRKATGSVVG